MRIFLPERRRGFTLVEIMIVVGIIGLIAAVAIPNYLKHRTYTQTQVCINNLHQIDAAKHVWGVENNKLSTDTPADSDLFGNNLYIAEKPECPAGGTYTLNAIGTLPSCTVSGHAL